MKCPHCRYGTLMDEQGKGSGWNYSCRGGCGRVWIILDGKYWLAGFDAGGEIWEIQDGKILGEIRRQSELWEKLWNRVRL